MRVKNMTSAKTGRSVPNQFIITITETELINGEPIERVVKYFQSYKSVIAKKVMRCGRLFVYLDLHKWNYSTTTSKYRNQFLDETTKETKRKIKSGEYILADLN